jgi:hypothetical protein
MSDILEAVMNRDGIGDLEESSAKLGGTKLVCSARPTPPIRNGLQAFADDEAG